MTGEPRICPSNIQFLETLDVKRDSHITNGNCYPRKFLGIFSDFDDLCIGRLIIFHLRDQKMSQVAHDPGPIFPNV